MVGQLPHEVVHVLNPRVEAETARGGQLVRGVSDEKRRALPVTLSHRRVHGPMGYAQDLDPEVGRARGVPDPLRAPLGIEPGASGRRAIIGNLREPAALPIQGLKHAAAGFVGCEVKPGDEPPVGRDSPDRRR